MYKEASYKQKFLDLHDWMPRIVDSVKRDLRGEHLKKDLYFVKKFLQAKNIHKAAVEELAEAYSRAIREEENGEAIAEFIASRWLLKNSELYSCFERQLTQVSPDFAAIDELSAAQSERLIETSVQQFGAVNTYLFSVLNSVVFPREFFLLLKERAEEELRCEGQERADQAERLKAEGLRQELEISLARLTDKYEKKLLGLQKKYDQDVEGLKKQVAALQRQLQSRKS